PLLRHVGQRPFAQPRSESRHHAANPRGGADDDLGAGSIGAAYDGRRHLPGIDHRPWWPGLTAGEVRPAAKSGVSVTPGNTVQMAMPSASRTSWRRQSLNVRNACLLTAYALWLGGGVRPSSDETLMSTPAPCSRNHGRAARTP